MSSAIAIVLIALGAAVRFLPHDYNAVPIGAIAIFAGMHLPRRWAVAVPIAALLISDVVILWNSPYWSTLWSIESVVRYATFGLIVLGASLVKLDRLPALAYKGAALLGLSLVASTFFFLTSNFMVWAFPYEPGRYTPDFAGLLTCYEMAVPFFRTSLEADLKGTVVLFGISALIAPIAERMRKQPVVEPIRID